MKRGFLRYFYVGVQFIMLAVSIPKVATLFHAYDPATMGPGIAGLDIRSWLVGIAIDLTATFTTWAAMAKYDETRKRTALLAPGLIILFCTALSVIANYEDAATLAPQQYAHIALFTQPALIVNPLLISAPPVLVLMLVMLVPSVLARPRLKSAQEIAAEADEAEALITAQARVREAKARANAKVRGAQLSGLVDTAGVVLKRAAQAEQADEKPREAVEPSGVLHPEYTTDSSAPLPELPELPNTPSARVSKAMWDSMSLKDRVTKSGVITNQEIGEVLGIAATRARELRKDAEARTPEHPSVPGRSGVAYQALIDALYIKRTNDSFTQAQKLEKALGLRKRSKQQPPELHVVPSEAVEPVATVEPVGSVMEGEA